MKKAVEDLLAQALSSLLGDLLDDDAAIAAAVQLERTRDEKHGDFATNAAMILAKKAGMKPRDLADKICAALPSSPLIARTEIAGPGFINFHLSRTSLREQIVKILDQGDNYGRGTQGAGVRVNVEFVSANPTGPLHVGHGRHAAYGACVAALLDATGHDVHREYYVNDAGRQMDILTASVWLRYLQHVGEDVRFPSAGYPGDYVIDCAEELFRNVGENLRQPASKVQAGLPADAPDGEGDAHIDALIARTRELLGTGHFERVHSAALHSILGDIKNDLQEFGVTVDEFFSERRLVDDKLVQHALTVLRDRDMLYEKDGATWFPATRFGDEKDRVVVRENGVMTYFASDIAYHLNKRERGFDLLLDILGADHHGYVARVRAGLEAMGQPGDSLEVRLVQFVALYKGGKKASMGKRSGSFVTLRELRNDIGNDAARFFYIIRSNDQHLDFDLGLAKSRSSENPIYYIQYAHARICSVFGKMAEMGLSYDRSRGLENLEALVEAREKTLVSALTRYPEVVELASANRAPQHLAFYLRDLANEFHTYYNQHKFLAEAAPLRDARLALTEATRHVICNGLAILGVSAPQSM